MASLATLLIAAADQGQGRGNEASGPGGIAILIGVIVAVILAAAIGYLVVQRMQRSRRGAPEEQSHRRGRVGRL